jgi:aminobenzoyl-glutamate transport protein
MPSAAWTALEIWISMVSRNKPLFMRPLWTLRFVRRYLPEAGLGTLLALMMPYALVFAIAWSLLLGGWVAIGWELGPGGPLF